MQGARDYEMQFNNILKKEEYRKYDAYNQSFCFNYFCVLEDILTNTFSIGTKNSLCEGLSMHRATLDINSWMRDWNPETNSFSSRLTPKSFRSKVKVMLVPDFFRT